MIGGGPAWGIAAGILFAAGDVSTKMAVSGGAKNIPFLICLIAYYAAGTAVLQAGFQRGGALTTAGLATLLTNALPIAAGMIVFNEPLPGGWVGAAADRLVRRGGRRRGPPLLAHEGAERGGATRPGGRARGRARPSGARVGRETRAGARARG